MENNPITARQRMQLQIANQRRALLAGKAKISVVHRQLDSAAKTLEIAQTDIQRGEMIDLDLPDIIMQLKEMVGLLQESERHIDRHIGSKHL